MIKLNDKKIKELILSGKNLKQSEFDTIRNRSDEFKNIVFIKKQGVKKNEYLRKITNIKN